MEIKLYYQLWFRIAFSLDTSNYTVSLFYGPLKPQPLFLVPLLFNFLPHSRRCAQICIFKVGSLATALCSLAHSN